MLKKIHKCEQEILDEIVRICENNNLRYVLIGGTLLGAARHKGFIPWDDDLDIAMPRKDYKKFIKICTNKEELGNKFIIDCLKTNSNYYLPFIKIRNKNTIYEQIAQKNYKGEKGIWVDIFPLDNAKSENSEWKKEKIINRFKGALCIKNLENVNYKKSNIKKIAMYIIKILPNKFFYFLMDEIMFFNKNENSKYFVNFGSNYGVKKQIHLKAKYFPATELEFEGKLYKVPNDYKYVLKKIYGDNYMELPPKEKRVTHNPLRVRFEDGEEYFFEN